MWEKDFVKAEQENELPKEPGNYECISSETFNKSRRKIQKFIIFSVK